MRYRQPPQRSAVPDDRGERRRRRAARGADRRPVGIRAAVDRARDRRRVPDAAHVPRDRTGGRGACASRTTRRPIARSTSGYSAATSSSVTTSTASSAPARPRSAQSGRRSGGRAARARDARGRHGRRRAPDMTTRVRELVVMLLGTGTCTIDRVAQHLGVDRRTIHRHLPARARPSPAWSSRAARARGALREGAPALAGGGVVAARFLRAERVLPLVPAAVQRPSLETARARRRLGSRGHAPPSVLRQRSGVRTSPGRS